MDVDEAPGAVDPDRHAYLLSVLAALRRNSSSAPYGARLVVCLAGGELLDDILSGRTHGGATKVARQELVDETVDSRTLT